MIERFRNSSAFTRFWDIAGGASIRVKVLGIVIGVILLLSLFVTLQMRHVFFETLHHDLETQAIALTLHMADTVNVALTEENASLLSLVLAELQTHYSNDSHNTKVAYIVVFDLNGAVVASTLPADNMPDALLPRNLDVPAANLHHRVTRLTVDQHAILDVATTLPSNRGIVRLGLSEDRINQAVTDITLQFVSITLLMIAVGFAAAFFLTWILTRPITSLVAATRAVSQGDFSRRVPRWANDEIGELASAFNEMTESLAQAEQERTERDALRARYVSGVIIAQEEERKRIARELHDSTGQSLTSLLVGLQNLKSETEATPILHDIESLQQTVTASIDEVRNLARQLRPSALDDLGLLSALNHLIEEYQKRNQIAVDFAANGLTERLPVELETTIYRIIQEALTNVARHARADQVSVLIDKRRDTIRLIVEDNGIGMDADSQKTNHLGLQGIHERAALFGGTLTIESQPGQGTSLFIIIPYPAPEANP
ncbi:MAG: ATPase [Anaerolineaceae bacterium]|nr:ATPase [Anaerolineaceae bacterium]